MELRHLRYFLAVAEEGSLTVAAERRLHTAQPSLSRQIRDLEYEVGAQLLVRSARGVELTDSGRTFLDHARLAFAQVDAAVEAARRAAQPARKTFAIGFQTGHEMTWPLRGRHQTGSWGGQYGDGHIPGCVHPRVGAYARLCEESAAVVRGQPSAEG